MALPGGFGTSPPLTTPASSLIGHFAGWSVSFILSGATLTVFATYLAHFPTERPRYRLATSGSVLCVVVATAINMVSLVRMGASADRSVAHLRQLSVASDVNPLLTVLSALFTQGVLSERAFRLNSRNRWLLAWLVVCMVGEAGLGILATTERYISRADVKSLNSRILSRALMAARTWMVVTDLCLVASLFVGLRRLSRSLLDDAEYQGRGKKVISRVWRTSVEAAVWPTLLCVATVIIAAATPQNAAWFFLVTPSIPPVYSLSLFYTLEQRRRYHEDLAGLNLPRPSVRAGHHGPSAGSPVLLFAGGSPFNMAHGGPASADASQRRPPPTPRAPPPPQSPTTTVTSVPAASPTGTEKPLLGVTTPDSARPGPLTRLSSSSAHTPKSFILSLPPVENEKSEIP